MKLSKDVVAEIRKHFKLGHSQVSIAKKFKISRDRVSKIVWNYSYRDKNYKPPARRKPIDIEYCKEMASTCRYSYSRIGELEAVRTGRSHVYSGEMIRKVVIGERCKNSKRARMKG